MTLRAPREDELDALIELVDEQERAAFGQAEVTAELLRWWLTQPIVDVARDLRVLESGGRLVGHADVDPTPGRAAALVVRRQDGADAGAAATAARLVAWLDERAGGCRLPSGAEPETTVPHPSSARSVFEPVRHSRDTLCLERPVRG